MTDPNIIQYDAQSVLAFAIMGCGALFILAYAWFDEPRNKT